MDDENNNCSESKTFPTAELEFKAEDVRRPGPAWEGRQHHSEAADCATSGCQVTTLLPTSSVEPAEMSSLLHNHVCLSAEGSHQQTPAAPVAADIVKDKSNAVVPNVITPNESEASNCTGEEDTSGGLLASNGGDTATIPRRHIGHVAALRTTPSLNRPANQFRFLSKADVGQRNSDEVAKSELQVSKESCLARTGETTATVQQKQQEARRPIASHRVFESNISLDRVSSKDNEAAERDRRSSRRIKGDFEALLVEAMQQSDAERVQDREDASNFALMQNPSLQEEQGHHLHETTPGPTRSAKNDSADGRTSCSDHDNGGQIDSKYGTTDLIAAIDSRLRSALPASVSELTPARCQWVQYISPEGYPYLYNEVTGESKWDPSGEVEGGDRNESQEVRGPTGDKSSREQGGTDCTLFCSQEGEVDPHGISVANAEVKGTTTHVAEHSSVSTCDVSQWSQDTSGPDARNSSGETAMHLAASQRSLQGLSLLLANGANINAIDHRGRTPLHAVCASARGSYSGGQDDPTLLECTNLLLSSGALEDARDGEGQTALHLAALAGNLSAAKALLEAGAKVIADDIGNSPLHVAAARGHSDIIQLLVDENKHESTWRPPLSSDQNARDHGWIYGEVGRLSTATDSVLVAEGSQAGAVPVDRQTGTFPGNRGEDFGAVARVNQRRRSAEQEVSSSREYYSHCTSREVQTVAGGPSASKVEHRHSGEWHFLKSPRGSLDGQFRRAGVHFENYGAGCPEDTGTRGKIFESPTIESVRTSDVDTSKDRGSDRLGSERGRRRRSEPKEGRKHVSGRPRLRRGDDRGDRKPRWSEALPEAEYQKIMEGALAGEEDSCRRPSRPTVSAALFAACLRSRPIDVASVLRLLKLYGGQVADVRDDRGRTPLHHVCCADDVGLFHLLHRAGADLEARDCQGNSPLTVAAATGSLACLRVLIQEGSYLCGFNDVGDTPLHFAVRHGNLACVKALVEGGARLSQRNKQGFTPREDLLKVGPIFSGGRLPKVLRIILEYIDCVEPEPPTWTVQDGHQSQATADTPAPLHKCAGGRLHDDALGAHSTRYEVQLGTGDDSSHPDANPRSATTERRQYQRQEGHRDLRGGRDTDQGRTEVSSDGSMRRNSNRKYSGVGYGMHQAPAEDDVMVQRRSDNSREGEISGGYSQESSIAPTSAPSRVRKGVWGVVGRAIDAFIGGGNGEHQHRPQPAAIGSDEFSDSDPEVYDNERPTTDVKLRATMASDEEESFRLSGSDILSVSSETQSPPSAEPVNVPISLTPMQPPPDVLAAMKGRAAVGHRRRQLISPPADVAAVLEKNWGGMQCGRRESYRSVLGADDDVTSRGSLGRSAKNL